jgi:glucokinase
MAQERRAEEPAAGLLVAAVALAAAGAGLALGLALGKRAGARKEGAGGVGVLGRGGHLLGVDIGGTGVKVGVVALDGRVLSSVSQEIADATLDGVVALIGQLADRALGEAGLQARDLSGLGVCVPGMVDVEAGCVNFAAHFSRWPRPAPLAARVSRRLGGLPVALENDGKVALMAEVWLGAARGSRNAVMLTLGTGVGGAIVSDGRLIKGHTGLAGEVGHM